MSLFFPDGSDFESCDYLGKTEEEYFQDFLKKAPITVNRLDTILREFFSQGYNDAFFQGQQQGFSEGSEDKANEIVQYMLQMKVFSIDQIVQATRVDKDDVLSTQKYLEDRRSHSKKRKKGNK